MLPHSRALLMPTTQYIVRLNEQERDFLESIVRKGKGGAFKIRRAQILLHSDVNGPKASAATIAKMLHCRKATVYDVRLLALVLVMTMAYCLATVAGYGLKKLKVNHYVARLNEHCRQRPRHSDFGTALYGHLWCCGMEVWTQLASELMQLKPHKRLNYQRGMKALSLIQTTL